jgi:hypothetical protein
MKWAALVNGSGLSESSNKFMPRWTSKKMIKKRPAAAIIIFFVKDVPNKRLIWVLLN